MAWPGLNGWARPPRVILIESVTFDMSHFRTTSRRARTLVIGVGLATILSACGGVYVSSRVGDAAGAGLDVRVLPVTAESVLLANRSPYAGQSLPEAFYQSAGGGSPRGAGTVPTPPDLPITPPARVSLDPPPAAEPGPYLLGSGDVLRMTLAGSLASDPITGTTEGSNIPLDLAVRDDGMISIPRVGVIDVAGQTVDEAERRIFEGLVSAGLTPDFGLQVVGYNAQRVAIGGALGAPQNITLTANRTSLGQGLAAAGGLQVPDPEFAVIGLYRGGRLYRIPVSDYLARGDLQNIALLAGDAVYVDRTFDLDRAQDFYESQLSVIALRRQDRTAALAELQAEIGLRRAALSEQRELFLAREELGATDRDYVYLTGEVARQSRWPMPYGRTATLADVLYDGGGLSPATSNPGHIYVLRSSADPAAFGAVTAWHLDASNAVALTLATRFEMRPDDIVFVEEQPITRWNRAMQQSIPSLIIATTNAVN